METAEQSYSSFLAIELSEDLGLDSTTQILTEITNKATTPETLKDCETFMTLFLSFDQLMLNLTKKILVSATKRKLKGISAFTEQDYKEQINHLCEHLKAWTNDEAVTEDSVFDEAVHAACRANLALFAYMIEKHIQLSEVK